MEISPLFAGMDTSASGLAAQRKRMNAIAENIANAETTRTAEGGPYRRQKTVLSAENQFELELDANTERHGQLARADSHHLRGRITSPELRTATGVTASIAREEGFREVYDPNHPDADANGIVRMPNVDIVQEMTELISAARAFEANVTAFNATKSMMKKALEL